MSTIEVNMETPTSQSYKKVISTCKDIFIKKMKDYGTAWRILRPSSITDQIFIKAQRIRSIEEKGSSRVDEGIIPEYKGIINYAIIGLIQLELGTGEDSDMSKDEVLPMYEKYFARAQKLMEDKNHDYDEAWRDMRVSSFTDLILMKLLRVKQIEDNEGSTLVSEGIDANFYDIINYSVFALIKLEP